MSNLSRMMKLYLAANDIEQKSLCLELGISQSSLTRFLQGNSLDMANTGRLIAWLLSEPQEGSDEDKAR
jgi:hypothetical protein